MMQAPISDDGVATLSFARLLHGSRPSAPLDVKVQSTPGKNAEASAGPWSIAGECGSTLRTLGGQSRTWEFFKLPADVVYGECPAFPKKLGCECCTQDAERFFFCAHHWYCEQ